MKSHLRGKDKSPRVPFVETKCLELPTALPQLSTDSWLRRSLGWEKGLLLVQPPFWTRNCALFASWCLLECYGSVAVKCSTLSAYCPCFGEVWAVWMESYRVVISAFSNVCGGMLLALQSCALLLAKGDGLGSLLWTCRWALIHLRSL